MGADGRGNSDRRKMKSRYDIVVIGAGHAGCEAALAAARMGLSVAVVTLERSGIGRMSCNPSIGGLAKGHLVREIDALGGEMARAIDATGIHYKILNRSRGPAVQAPRAQADRNAYEAYMLGALEGEAGLDIIEGEAADLIVENGNARGVRTADDVKIRAGAVILTAGTFLRGRMYVGEETFDGGRRGEPAAARLSDSMRAIGFRTTRLKTGTPPRVFRDSILFEKTEEQPPDVPPPPFSFQTKSIDRPQVSCWITRTTEETHKVIRSCLDRSPLFTGRIEGAGPRYCLSIEDKVVRFPHHDFHQIFLEIEGDGTDLVYPNGLATSLPEEGQREFLRTIPGLEKSEMALPGYAVEYDFFPTDQIRRSLETKRIGHLYFAGQVNGTSGYEEAAAQGLIAGINAVHRLDNKDPVHLTRSESYIGVLIDDLVTCNPTEPYRMFTSRAEHRLLLRHDNADIRLAALGRRLGLIPEEVHLRAEERDRLAREEIKYLSGKTARVEGAAPVRLDAFLRRPEVTYENIIPMRGERPVPEPPVRREVEIRIKYAGYVKRQKRVVEKLSRMEGRPIPAGFDYESVRGFSREGSEKLIRYSPETVGVASRIDGVTPADLSLLVVHLDRKARAGKKR